MTEHSGIARTTPFEKIVSHYQPLNPKFWLGKYRRQQHEPRAQLMADCINDPNSRFPCIHALYNGMDL